MPQHLPGGAGPQPVRVIDAVRVSDHGLHQREVLAAGPGATHPAHQAHRGVDQRLESQPVDERRRQDQPSVSTERLVIEGRPDAIDSVG